MDLAQLQIYSAIRLLWGIFVLIWLISAFTTKRTVQVQSGSSRVVQLAFVILAYYLVLAQDFPVAWLNQRLTPDTLATATLGFVIFVAGLLFATWARFRLGGNWSSSVTLKENHTLVRSGPYRIVRHPIYTGLTLALLGTAIAFGQIRCFLGVVLALVAWKLKSSTEERLMRQQFGVQYTAYQKEVKALIPWVW
jgi:protein-S-isoprenylcysteine O-methyltransferase Ste14